MLMPKAPVDKHDFLVSGQDYVWISWEMLIVQTKTEAHAMNQRANQDFRLSVPAAHFRHNLASLFGRKNVRRHESPRSSDLCPVRFCDDNAGAAITRLTLHLRPIHTNLNADLDDVIVIAAKGRMQRLSKTKFR